MWCTHCLAFQRKSCLHGLHGSCISFDGDLISLPSGWGTYLDSDSFITYVCFSKVTFSVLSMFSFKRKLCCFMCSLLSLIFSLNIFMRLIYFYP